MLEFVDSDLYFVQDKNNFINPLLQVGSGSVEKSNGSGSGGPKITRSGSSSLEHTPGAASEQLETRAPGQSVGEKTGVEG